MAWLAAADQKGNRSLHTAMGKPKERSVADLELLSYDRREAGRRYLQADVAYADLLELEAPKGDGPEEPAGIA
jgi:hypothetical protein